MRRWWPLTFRGTGALILAVGSIVLANELAIGELIYIGILLLAVLATAVASLYLVPRTDQVTRALTPDIASVGHDVRVTARVSVRTALPTPPGSWQDALPKALGGHAQGPFPALGSGLRGGGRLVELRYDVTGLARGIHPLGPLRVTSTDPFGLARRTYVLGETTAVTVAPAVVDLAPLTDFAGETGGTLQTTMNRLGQGADNLIPRSYLPGDSMRRIHWRASAHQGDLMVRQEEQESTPEATVVLDRCVLRWSIDALHAPGNDPGFEIAVSAAASALTRLARDGYAVDLIDASGAELAERIHAGDVSEVESVVQHLATLTARRDDHLAHLARQFAGILTGPVVLVVGRLDPADADAIAPVAHHSTMPVLFVVAPVGDAVERARSHGWRVAVVDPDADLAAAWSAVVSRGVSNVVR